MGELMARWLEGDITYQPGYGGEGPDSETDPLVAGLAAVNRAGYVTTFSQPGEMVEDWFQRAAVDGFCDEATATRIYDGVLETEVIPLVWQPGAMSDLHQIPVSREGTHQNTWCGHPFDAENIGSLLGPAVHPEGLAAIHGAFQVVLIDPEWGRNDLLWPSLASALGLGHQAVCLGPEPTA